eukprot:gene896-56830_t
MGQQFIGKITGEIKINADLTKNSGRGGPAKMRCRPILNPAPEKQVDVIDGNQVHTQTCPKGHRLRRESTAPEVEMLDTTVCDNRLCRLPARLVAGHPHKHGFTWECKECDYGACFLEMLTDGRLPTDSESDRAQFRAIAEALERPGTSNTLRSAAANGTVSLPRLLDALRGTWLLIGQKPIDTITRIFKGGDAAFPLKWCTDATGGVVTWSVLRECGLSLTACHALFCMNRGATAQHPTQITDPVQLGKLRHAAQKRREDAEASAAQAGREKRPDAAAIWQKWVELRKERPGSAGRRDLIELFECSDLGAKDRSANEDDIFALIKLGWSHPHLWLALRKGNIELGTWHLRRFVFRHRIENGYGNIPGRRFSNLDYPNELQKYRGFRFSEEEFDRLRGLPILPRKPPPMAKVEADEGLWRDDLRYIVSKWNPDRLIQEDPKMAPPKEQPDESDPGSDEEEEKAPKRKKPMRKVGGYNGRRVLRVKVEVKFQCRLSDGSAESYSPGVLWGVCSVTGKQVYVAPDGLYKLRAVEVSDAEALELEPDDSASPQPKRSRPDEPEVDEGEELYGVEGEVPDEEEEEEEHEEVEEVSDDDVSSGAPGQGVPAHLGGRADDGSDGGATSDGSSASASLFELREWRLLSSVGRRAEISDHSSASRAGPVCPSPASQPRAAPDFAAGRCGGHTASFPVLQER